MIKINNLVIGRFNIDGKKTIMTGKPMQVTTAPLSPRKHMQKVREVNNLRRRGEKKINELMNYLRRLKHLKVEVVNDPILTQDPENIGDK